MSLKKKVLIVIVLISLTSSIIYAEVNKTTQPQSGIICARISIEVSIDYEDVEDSTNSTTTETLVHIDN